MPERNQGKRIIEFVAASGYKDEPELDENGKPVLRRTTAVHHATSLDYHLFKIYNRFDINYVDEDGYTHFHAACKYNRYDIVEEFLKLGQDPDCLPREPNTNSVDSPLHFALKSSYLVGAQKKVIELLLKSGADPNSPDKEGSTPLHVIYHCNRRLIKTFFEIIDANHLSIQIDAKDRLGRTVLHLALADKCEETAELLLTRGADPNAAMMDGSTPLHIICQQRYDIYRARFFFKISDDRGQVLQVNAVNDLGQTPLHLAIKYNIRSLTKVLLRIGANSNLADGDGSTPLHTICKQGSDDQSATFLKMFLRINDAIQQTLQVDRRDKCGMTPLQWAVAYISPNTVDILLDRGADLSNFVFPTERYFAARWDTGESNLNIGTSGALAVVEHLEKRGYELDRSDALTIMKVFYKHGSLNTWKNFEEMCNNKCFVESAKELMIKPSKSLSLYDFIRLPLEEAMRRKLITYTDYFEFESSNLIKSFSLRRELSSCLRVAVAGQFVRQWALEIFMLLTRYQLPILCCDNIIEQLTSGDLLKVCVAIGINANEQNQKM
uniref:PRANC domain-containing protein n=1 Tax=Trichogramma kaykai TaxID=54128 RepID=A0ABD2WKE3_9HYME